MFVIYNVDPVHVLLHQMTLGGMAFGYVMCNIQSNSVSTASGGLRGLKLVTIPFSLLIMLVS